MPIADPRQGSATVTFGAAAVSLCAHHSEVGAWPSSKPAYQRVIDRLSITDAMGGNLSAAQPGGYHV
jgi:hypothetical protein